ncbi:MAG: hypothetical protein JNJ51_09420 [Methylobacillus glycogenes]|nr:hypothetical protein [Methylobacillus glycogenes]
MKLIIAVLSIGSVMLCTSAYAEQVNPRALDDKNTPSQQDKESSKGAKAKSTENATEQQSDPNIKSKTHPDKQKSGHDSTTSSTKTH